LAAIENTQERDWGKFDRNRKLKIIAEENCFNLCRREQELVLLKYQSQTPKSTGKNVKSKIITLTQDAKSLDLRPGKGGLGCEVIGHRSKGLMNCT
jgi:hypothetical protein